MDVKTYRARSLQDALRLVRADLGPQAAVLQTRQLRSGLLWRLMGVGGRVEVAASASVHVPSRFETPTPAAVPRGAEPAPARIPPAHEQDFQQAYREVFAVPEPSVLLLLATGLVWGWLIRHRCRFRKTTS